MTNFASQTIDYEYDEDDTPLGIFLRNMPPLTNPNPVNNQEESEDKHSDYLDEEQSDNSDNENEDKEEQVPFKEALKIPYMLFLIGTTCITLNFARTTYNITDKADIINYSCVTFASIFLTEHLTKLINFNFRPSILLDHISTELSWMFSTLGSWCAIICSSLNFMRLDILGNTLLDIISPITSIIFSWMAFMSGYFHQALNNRHPLSVIVYSSAILYISYLYSTGYFTSLDEVPIMETPMMQSIPTEAPIEPIIEQVFESPNTYSSVSFIDTFWKTFINDN